MPLLTRYNRVNGPPYNKRPKASISVFSRDCEGGECCTDTVHAEARAAVTNQRSILLRVLRFPGLSQVFCYGLR